MTKAGIEQSEFHDLRRTCLTNWLANGLSEFDVMTMAGHTSFEGHDGFTWLSVAIFWTVPGRQVL